MAARFGLKSLVSQLGRRQAHLEVRWMKQAIENDALVPKGFKHLDLCSMIERRVQGEPLQYILGTQPFGSLNLLTRPPVLIPRSETEDWTIRLSNLLNPSPLNPISMLDLCTGSGCIPLLLCHLWSPGSLTSWGVDISPQAIRLACDNAVLCDFSAVQDTAASQHSPARKNSFIPIQCDVLKWPTTCLPSLPKPFDLLTSNPPYITRTEYAALPLSVKDYEDPLALLGDPPDAQRDDHGLTFYRHIAKLLKPDPIRDWRLVKEGGVVAVEIGWKQGMEVKEIMESVGGLKDVEVWKDPWEKDRVVVGKAP